MITTAPRPHPHPDFWHQLTTRVAEIGQRVRKPKQPLLKENSFQAPKLSRFQIEGSVHRAQQQELSLNNRIRFLQTQRTRQERTLQLARRKYERMREVRAQSIQEKQQCRELLQQSMLNNTRDVSRRAERVRRARTRIAASVQRVRDINREEAQSLRTELEQCDADIENKLQEEQKHKRKQVQRLRSSLQTSRMFLSRMHAERVERGKADHKVYLQEKLTINYEQKRKNSLLKQKLQEALQTVSQSKEQRLGKLREYQTLTLMRPRHAPSP